MTRVYAGNGRVRECFERDGFGIVPLTRGFEAIVDLVDLHRVCDHNWLAMLTARGHAYASRSTVVDGRRMGLMMHRLLMNAPDDRVVDHINGDGLDNRRANLRICTQGENLKNTAVTRRNKLGMKGAYAYKNRFRSSIQVNRRTIHLGSYRTPEEAAAAYRGAAKALFGEFANE